MSTRTPAEIVDFFHQTGQIKLKQSWFQALLLGFLAGAYIALGGLLALVVGGGVPGLQAQYPGLQKLLFGGVFPVGLMFVVLSGAELFTGNAATLIPAWLKGPLQGRQVLRHWALVYGGNFAGSVFVAFFLAHQTGLVASSPWLETTVQIAQTKVSQNYWVLFWKAVGCNWLVCLAVWLAAASRDSCGKIWGIWFPIMAFVALGFEHCVANMFFIPLGLFQGAEASWLDFLQANLVPVTLGNLVGGGLFVGGFYTWLYAPEQK